MDRLNEIDEDALRQLVPLFYQKDGIFLSGSVKGRPARNREPATAED